MTSSPHPLSRRSFARVGVGLLPLLIAVIVPVAAVPASSAGTPPAASPGEVDAGVAPVPPAPSWPGQSRAWAAPAGPTLPTGATPAVHTALPAGATLPARAARPARSGLTGARPAAAAPAALWLWPVGPPHDLLRAFEVPASSYGAGHRGIDLVVQSGAPVRAPADGVVSFSGVVVDRPVVSIQHAEDLVSSFEPVAATVSVGERVVAGQVIGVVASGAHCADRCVHFGVRRHGQYISPVLFLGGLARAVLLPLPPDGPLFTPRAVS